MDGEQIYAVYGATELEWFIAATDKRLIVQDRNFSERRLRSCRCRIRGSRV
jgi:hypothetical protein